jgi:hypothetical protein
MFKGQGPSTNEGPSPKHQEAKPIWSLTGLKCPGMTKLSLGFGTWSFIGAWSLDAGHFTPSLVAISHYCQIGYAFHTRRADST